jgi:hypothetical protein
LYSFIVDRRPERYVEVGSGHSTRFARRAINDAQTGTRITSIDPAPRAEVEPLCEMCIVWVSTTFRSTCSTTSRRETSS